MKRILIWGVIVIVLLFLLAPVFAVPIMIAFYLLFGWISFPLHTLPKMTFEPVALGVGAAALVLLAGFAHGLARWLYASMGAPRIPPRRWRLRWSLAIVGIVVLLFASGISFLVTIHETGWLLTAREPWFTSGGEAYPRFTSNYNLKQIGLAFHTYAQKEQAFPPGGTFNDYGEMQHSWETMLLPYLEHSDLKPDMTVPWNHPKNAECFKKELREFLNPGVRSEQRVDAQGYGLSHYSANSRVLGPNSTVRFKDVTDGTSNTLLGGEVNANFRPWGHPVNWRDPALGINKSPEGFGAPWASGGANMLFMDGSAKFISEKVDPAVLRALSTPNGGEKLPDSWGP